MKKFLLAVVSAVFVSFSNAQITITKNDFAGAGDTARVSIAQIDFTMPFSDNGANVTWDFSNLQWNTQRVDQFLNVVQPNLAYVLYFSDVSFNPHRCNVAMADQSTTTSLPVALFSVSDIYNFYYKSNSAYVQRGIGEKINGLPTGITYSHDDIIYSFPMNYGNTDTSQSGYKISVPSVGAYAHTISRTNLVDGWGTLITPFGTFPVLRQVSDIYTTDSFYIDALNFGFNIPAVHTREYKWIGNDQKEPLLQVNTSVLFNFDLITSVVYRDSFRFRPVVNGISPVLNNPDYKVYPNPATTALNFSLPVALQGAQVQITDALGNLIYQQQLNGATETISTQNWAAGMYFVSLSTPQGTQVKKIIKQ